MLFSADSFDTEKLLDSMENLRHGQAVDIPNYDFKSYKNSVFPARRVCSQNVQNACYYVMDPTFITSCTWVLFGSRIAQN